MYELDFWMSENPDCLSCMLDMYGGVGEWKIGYAVKMF